MTTEAIAPNSSAFSERRPISRFFKWFKPDYTVIAAKFLGGVVLGFGSALCATSGTIGNICGYLAPVILPEELDKVTDNIFSDELNGSKSPLSSKAMNVWSVGAIASGELVGSMAAYIVTNNDPVTDLPFLSFQISMGAIITGIDRIRRPPSGPSLTG